MGILERIKAKRSSGNSAARRSSVASEKSPTNSITEKSEEAEAGVVEPTESAPPDDEKQSEPAAKENDTAVEEQAAEVEDESKYPSGFPLAILTFGLCVSIFVVALDNTIIGELIGCHNVFETDSILATAIPRITTVFNSLNDVGWYGSSYLLTQTSLQPSFGKIYTYFNVKWTFIISLLIFEGRDWFHLIARITTNLFLE